MQSIIDTNTREELQGLWAAIFLVDPPDDATWDRWLKYYPQSIVRAGLLQLAIKHKRTYMDADHMVRFASSVMGRLDRDRRAALEKLKMGAASWHPSNTHVPATITETEEVNGNH